MNVALITGINGQDGSYIADLLLSKGYEVHGTIRTGAMLDPNKLRNIAHIKDNIVLHELSLEDFTGLSLLFNQIKPDEIYHFASPSTIQYSFAGESSLLNLNLTCTNYLLSLIYERKQSCRFFFAGSSEIFGYTNTLFQNEQTPLQPRSLYGIAKANGYFITKYFRERKNIHSSTGIMYNHESVRRGNQFATKYICREVVKICKTGQGKIKVGNLNSKRDWGYAPDYVQAIWKIMQQDNGDDYIISTGELNSIREIIDLAFSIIKGEGYDWEPFVEIVPDIETEPFQSSLCGIPDKLTRIINWKRSKSFRQIIEEIVNYEIEKVNL